MSTIYEGMFLVDNDAVRSGWQGAKSTVVDLIQKHGGTAHTSRRWDECKLAYPIKGKKRATYLLTYYEIPTGSIASFTRDLEINETVLRYLLLSAEEIPEEERTKSAAEMDADFSVPAPPEDDAPEVVEEEEEEAEASAKDDSGAEADDEAAKAETVPASEDTEEKKEGE